jgi:hypothetical protein
MKPLILNLPEYRSLMQKFNTATGKKKVALFNKLMAFKFILS